MNIFEGVTKIDWGFNAGDIWTNSMFIVASLSTFILLGLAVAFAPQIISLIKGVLRRGRKA